MLNNLNLKTAVWIYDIENFRILWANNAALEWWQRFHFGESMCELWQFSPGGEAKQAFCQLSGVEIGDKMTLMVEATAVDLLQPLMGENAIAILPTFDQQGQFKSCNPPFEREFSERVWRANNSI